MKRNFSQISNEMLMKDVEIQQVLSYCNFPLIGMKNDTHIDESQLQEEHKSFLMKIKNESASRCV